MPAINDLELANQGWRNYPELITDSLWTFPKRAKGNGHDGSYHGNFIPQVPEQVIRRFTRAGDVVLDLFCGSGTTLLEAQRLGRNSIGVDLLYGWQPDTEEFSPLQTDIATRLEATGNPHEVTTLMLQGDSGSCATLIDIGNKLWQLHEKKQADLIFLHPPYWDIVKFSEHDDDLSNAVTLEEFRSAFKRVADNVKLLLKPGGYVCLVIGDKYAAGEWVPLAFECMSILRDAASLTLKAINIKDVQGNEKGKGKNNNLWRVRALKNGLYVFKHEYILIFRSRVK